ncbi:DUF3848 domain-containing protein [[Clostridium] fimetarium]|uniref:Uncharacterized protein n=1 Tax=[Clostridium] fimetarium TaxID=99656 RepID=A0A1I0Q026_9FIRM|nr:DUF3848 domain-containing protein [[Clostridium] fimetarium]SEW20309.1 Protein of unknown function [[Clostridium] fimetarium]
MKTKDRLTERFLLKISTEYLNFKISVVMKNHEEIYAMAYEIDHIARIYLILQERADQIPAYMLKALYQTPELIKTVYDIWMNHQDSSETELNGFVVKILAMLSDKNTNLKKGA